MNQSHHQALDAAGRRRTPIPALALLVLATAGVLAAGASASGTLPLSPTSLNASNTSNGLQVKPTTIIYTGDGTGFLGGASARARHSGIKWTKWTTTVALGKGFNQLNDCSPSCAGGTFHGYPVRIEQWRPRMLGGVLVFTRMTLFYGKSRPPGQPRHYTFTDTYSVGTGGGYGWGPPDELDYCTHTHGFKPAAGCSNIHSLP
ncbi:MAG: hypothetical protein ACYDA6_05360 [Solirubrobacteraceae bacterium]